RPRFGAPTLPGLPWTETLPPSRRHGQASRPRVEDANLRAGIRPVRHGDEEPPQLRGEEPRPGPGRRRALRQHAVVVGIALRIHHHRASSETAIKTLSRGVVEEVVRIAV